MRKKTVLILTLISSFLFLSKGENTVLRFKHITADNGLPNNAIYSIAQDKYGFIWIASLDGLSRFDGYKLKVYSGNHKLPDKPLNNRPIAIFNDKSENLLIAFSLEPDRVCRYNFEKDNFTRIPITEVDTAIQNKIKRYTGTTQRLSENKKYTWDNKSSCLTQTNKLNGTKYIYKSDSKASWSILDEFTLSLFLDRQDVLWVGTDNGGVSYADINQPDFTFYPFQNSTENNMKESTIRAINQDANGNLWIGARNNGFSKLDKSGKQTLIFRNDPTNKNSLTNNSVRKIYADSHGYLWIGTKGGLDKFDPRTRKFEHFLFDLKKVNPRNWIFSLFEDSEGILWAGTWLGLARYDREHNKFISYFKTKKVSVTQIRDILEDKNGNLWVATQGNGLFVVKKQYARGKLNLIIKQYLNIQGNTNSLINDWLFCLCLDNYGMIWIGSGSGLNRLNPKTMTFTQFQNSDFIDEHVIHGILYEKGFVWVSHQNGLTQIDCKTLKTRYFTKKYDLYENEFSEDAFFKNQKTGELFFGGNKGFISFYPHKIKPRTIQPRVVLSDLKISNNSVTVNQKVNNRILLSKPIYLTKKIELKWSERNIQIDFAALYFPAPETVKYAYRLKGFDNNWGYTVATLRSAIYSNLNAGKYIFEVKAANPDGVWSAEPTTLQIIILPPWWQTWWAYLSYFIISASIVFLAIKYIFDRQKYMHNIQIERVKAEKIKEMDELKTKLFTNVSHEFRTPLTLIIDPIEKLLQKEDNDQKTHYYYNLISKNAHRLMELINQFLDLKKIESGKLQLNPTYRDFILYIKSLAEYFELHAQLHDIHFSISTNAKQQAAYFDSEKMDKVILNLIINAFKNTPAGGNIYIDVNIETEKSLITLRITDSGVGIPADQLKRIFEPFYQVDQTNHEGSSGIGLTMVKELIQLHNGNIEVKSKEGKGTEFIISLPIIANNDVDVLDINDEKREKIDLGFNKINQEASSANEYHKTDLPTILIIEDNTEIRKYLFQELNDIFHVIEGVNGNDGLAKAIEAIPDLIVSDIMMPGLNGFELCKRVKTDERTSHIPVILLTAQQSDEYKVSGYETGADAYITKPFNTSMLRIRISNLIETRKKLRKLFDKSTGFNTDVIALNNADKLFMDRILSIINNHIGSTTFDVEELADKINMSRTQLYRKVKNLTNKSVQEFIATIRLKKAAEMILSGEYNITQVSEMVGFSEVGNFTRSFIKQYGMSPKAYKNSFQQKV
jgi:signal transduction histidine kinase/ligand-binding sensor domain-containing protein/DNA-binding response OmpR family regulator